MFSAKFNFLNKKISGGGGAFTPVAVLLTSGTSYTIPAGATTMKAWAVGGGGGGGANYQGFGERSGGAGGTAYKTWSVSGGSSVSYVIGAGSVAFGTSSVRNYGNDTTVTFGGVTITGGGGSKTGTYKEVGGTFSGGDGGANGGNGTGSWAIDAGGTVSCGAVGGNGGTVTACLRTRMTDVSGLKAALAIASVNTTEACQTTAAFGSGAAGNKYGVTGTPGIGGGGHSMIAGQSLPSVAGGDGAVILYFT